jgi:hypothetical protein
VGRRDITEYRAAEALTLIMADREDKDLVCPSCGAADIERVPKRADHTDRGRITLHCSACSREAVYVGSL